jgi:GTP-binding protein
LHILLNKADKLTRNQQIKTLNEVGKEINKNYATQSFSALRKTGVEELHGKIASWLEIT